MTAGRKRQPSLAWTLAKITGRIIWKLIDVALIVVGAAGVPDDFNTWRKWIATTMQWIGDVMHDPLVIQMAEIAVQIADFVNQWWVRLLLVGFGVAAMFWGWRPFWRLRHRIKFRWRRALSERVWISRDTALNLLKESRWGKIKEPHIVRPLDFLAGLRGLSTTVSGLSADQKNWLLFEEYVERTLSQFCDSNPEACRQADGEHQVDETSLRKFISLALQEETANQFGEVPNIKVT